MEMKWSTKGIRKKYKWRVMEVKNAQNDVFLVSCLQKGVPAECKRSINVRGYQKGVHMMWILSAFGVYQRLIFQSIFSLQIVLRDAR